MTSVHYNVVHNSRNQFLINQFVLTGKYFHYFLQYLNFSKSQDVDGDMMCNCNRCEVMERLLDLSMVYSTISYLGELFDLGKVTEHFRGCKFNIGQCKIREQPPHRIVAEVKLHNV